MPLMVGKRLMSNREQLSRLSMAELRAYQKALEGFMVTNSTMIATTLKQVYQEIEWRNASHPHQPAKS